MVGSNADELPREEEMLSDMEEIEKPLPVAEYGKDAKKLSVLVARLEKEYDKREKIIDRIIAYGTGVESEKALRMYSVPALEKWLANLKSFRAEQLKKKG
jgi:hypothetical protein